MMQQEHTEVNPPANTGERLDPETHPAEILQEHAARYVFAARYCVGKRVLDVASGVGYGTDYLRSHGANAVGLEIDEQSVRYARHQYPSSTFVQGSAEKMPNDWSAGYDVVVSFETIEHLERADNFLKEVFRCLRPGGLFICSTPNKSLYLFEGHNQFHVKEFYSGEFQRFIGTVFRVRQVFGQSLHPRWQVVFMGLHSVVRKVLRALHIPPLRVTTVFVDSEIPSPFEGNSICEERVRSKFLPTAIPSNSVPAFLVVLAEKSSK
jgi:2-polyprenyl-3-methyl-5-hydroxy-6-metoxy-1,4-benzoquinol methylase